MYLKSPMIGSEPIGRWTGSQGHTRRPAKMRVQVYNVDQQEEATKATSITWKLPGNSTARVGSARARTRRGHHVDVTSNPARTMRLDGIVVMVIGHDHTKPCSSISWDGQTRGRQPHRASVRYRRSQRHRRSTQPIVRKNHATDRARAPCTTLQFHVRACNRAVLALLPSPDVYLGAGCARRCEHQLPARPSTSMSSSRAAPYAH